MTYSKTNSPELNKFSVALKSMLFSVSYFIFALIGNSLSLPSSPFVHFWMPSGLYLAILLMNERKLWPFTVFAAYVANISFDLYHGQGLHTSILFCTGNTFEALLGASLTRKFVGKNLPFSRARDTLWFIAIAAVLSPMASATVGTLVVTLMLGGQAFAKTWMLWWSADLLGVLLAAPFVLVWLNRDRKIHIRYMLKRPYELISYFSVLIILTVVSFNQLLIPQLSLKYLLISLVVWATFRLGIYVLVSSNLLIALIAAAMASNGFFDVSVVDQEPVWKLISLQLFLATVVFIGFFINALLSERDKANNDLQTEIIERKKSEEEVNRKQKETKALYIATRLLIEESNFKETARKLFDICRGLIGGQSGYVALLSHDGAENKVLFLESGGLPCDVNPELPMPIRGLRAEAYKTGEVVYDNDFQNSEWIKYMPEGHVELRNVLFAPLMVENKAKGLMGIANKKEDFCKNDASIAKVFGELAAISLQKSLTREKLKYQEEQLRQSQKLEAIGNLAGGIAHDFNNMLGVISGNTSYLLNKFPENKEVVSVLSDVQEGTVRAQSLTQQLLTFAKGGAPVKKKTDLNSLIKESAEFVLRGAKSKCQFELEDDLWVSEVDQGQLNQVISNIVINANQAMPDGGIVKIKTENITINHKSTLPLPEDRYIKIVVRDQGVGISEKHLAKIFDPYFTTKHTGHGLGLATTYSIIKRHGGHITVDSEIDNGTTFTIYLPATSQKLEELTPLKVANHSGKGKILVMDDEDPILKVSKRILTSLGYEVVLAKDGLEAIESYKNYFAQNDPFDLTILDLTVPGGLGGAETIPGILKINPEAKIVVSSGYSNDPVMAKYKDYGLCGVLAKPYRQGQLAELLNEIFSETASS